MGISGRWYDPVSYQFSFSCMAETKELPQVPALFETFLGELQPYLLRELSAGRRFRGVMPGAIMPVMRTADDLALFVTHRRTAGSRAAGACSLCADGFLPRDAVPAKRIDPVWKQTVSRMMEAGAADTLTPAEKSEWLRSVMSGFSDGLEGIALPGRCFRPHFTPFYMGYQTTRCQSREEYDLFRESGALSGDGTAPRKAAHLLQTFRLSVPRAWFSGDGPAFPFQDVWVSRLKSVCSACRISSGSIRADVMLDEVSERPLSTFRQSIMLGFRQRIGEIGWAMALTGEQAERLGGTASLRHSGVFGTVEDLGGGRVYAQLTPAISRIPPEQLNRQWHLLEPLIETVADNVHSFLDAPVSLRLGLGAQNISADHPIGYSLRAPISAGGQPQY